jgi:hypothetical protein
MIFKTVLARLYEQGKTPMVELLLRSSMEGCYDDVDGFLEGLPESAAEEGNSGLTAARIKGCLQRTISILGKFIREFENFKLMVREFWTAV